MNNSDPSRGPGWAYSTHAITRPLAIVLFCLAVGTLVALGAAVGVSKWYWGYGFDRPAIDPVALQVQRVTSFTQVITENTNGSVSMRRVDPADPWAYDPADPLVLDSIRTAPLNDPYYNLEERIPAAMIEAGTLKQLPGAMPADQIERFHQRLVQTDGFVPNTPGYRAEDYLTGIVLEAERTDGTPIVIASLHSGEVSNDHRVFYEWVFRVDESGERFEPLSKTYFYYDLAGLEGMNWRGLTIVFCIFIWPIAMIVAAIVIAINASAAKRRRLHVDGVIADATR